MGQELEYKFRADSEKTLFSVFYRLCGDAPTQKIQMETRYFDTREGNLQAKRCTLRIRRENGQEVLTYKTPAQGHLRGEWNLVRTSKAPLPQPEELEAIGVEAMEDLRPLCGAAFCRTRCRISQGESLIEAAADVGYLWGGSRELPFWELELELLEGLPEDLDALAANCPLPEEQDSKAKRAFLLRKPEETVS